MIGRVLCGVRRLLRSEAGQSTVEAAFALPILMTLVLLLVQPGVILYDRIVMEGAAASACRFLATLPAGDEKLCEDFVLRRLGAVPPHEFFHVHDGGCTWEVELAGCEETALVGVSLSTEVKPLPLIGSVAALLGMLNENGNMTVRVDCTEETRPAWAEGSTGIDSPAALPGAWIESERG